MWVLDLPLNKMKGKCYRKLNSTWLINETYIKGIESLIPEVSKEYKNIEDTRIIWDIIKNQYKIICNPNE